MTKPAIEVKDLNFDYGGDPILANLNLTLPSGSRTLLVGANGAGKTTLLRILAGKRMVKAKVSVFGFDAYRETPSSITYLGPEWAANPVIRRDVSVQALLDSLNASEYPDRLEKLLWILDIDLSWRMHQVSDGERRRVQILLGLIKPFSLLLLDEVTVDLDVVVRRNLLNFLKDESLQGSTVVYATHIFDGLGDWPTHVAHMKDGTIAGIFEFQQLMKDRDLSSSFDSPLLTIVESWLREDFKTRKKNLKGSKKTHWDRLSENVKSYGDKYYNYWQ